VSGQVNAPITVHRVKVRMDGTQMAVDFTGTTAMLVLIEHANIYLQGRRVSETNRLRLALSNGPN
jgi:hypothetical protein